MAPEDYSAMAGESSAGAGAKAPHLALGGGKPAWG
jgi:hypothetical protein